MKRGDIVGKRHFTDFKGIIIDLVEYFTDDYGENEIIMWKVLWFKHPFENKPFVEEVLQHSLKGLEIETRN